MTPAHYLRMGATLGLSVREAMGMEPGLLFDLWELRGRGAKADG